MEKVRALLAGGYAGGVVRAMTEGVWRRSTDSKVYGSAALAVKALGAQCARAGGMYDFYSELTAACAAHGEEAVLAAAIEAAREHATQAQDRVGGSYDTETIKRYDRLAGALAAGGLTMQREAGR